MTSVLLPASQRPSPRGSDLTNLPPLRSPAHRARARGWCGAPEVEEDLVAGGVLGRAELRRVVAQPQHVARVHQREQAPPHQPRRPTVGPHSKHAAHGGVHL